MSVRILSIFIVVLLNISNALFAQSTLNPVANEKAIIKTSNARFTVLTPELIRMEWSADGRFTDDASFIFINRKLNVPLYKSTLSNGILTINTESLQIEYKVSKDSFSVDNLRINSMKGSDISFSWKPGTVDIDNLKGTMRTLDGVDSGSVQLLENGILSKSGWALIDDSKNFLFDGNKDWNWVKDRETKINQDWYFFGYGHNYKKALFDFTQVAGKIPLPPRYAFGYWWSRYWIYGEREMKELATTFKELDIPIDVMIIDMDWHNTYNFRGNAAIADGQGSIVGWTGYTWNKNLFPQPKKLFDWMEENQIKNALNLHPSSGIPPMEEKYEAFAKAYGFDTAGKKYIPYYGSDKKWARIYFDSILHPLEKSGVDFWWLDWQQYPHDRLKKGLSNTWWLNYMFFTDMEKQGKRPLLFHRWGGLGNHRYQIGFSGDSYITWKQLAFQPSFTATASNVGYGYWSHDIGGHQPGDPQNSELFERWVQWGVFSPILRTHSTKRAVIDRRIWKMKDNFLSIKDDIKLRYSLNPYIYTAAREAYDSGISICRPMYYNYPEKEEAYQFNQQYMFGDNMIIAPVVTKSDSTTGLSNQRIWLPEGNWFEWMTGSKLDGNKIVDRKFALNEIPVYIKAGSIIPMYPRTIKNLQNQIDTLQLKIFKGADGSSSVYEDNGNTLGYKHKEFAKTTISSKVNEKGNMLITINPVEGNYRMMHMIKYFQLFISASLPPSKVKVNGKEYKYNEKEKNGSWTYAGMDLEIRIFLPGISRKNKIVVEIEYDKNTISKEYLLNNKVMVFKRMSKVMEMLKYEISNVDWGAAIPDEILSIEQIPTRIDYDYKNTILYLEEMNSKYPLMLTALRKIYDVNQTAIEKIIQYLPPSVE